MNRREFAFTLGAAVPAGGEAVCTLLNPELLTYPPHEMSGFRREEARSAWPEGE